MTLTAPPHLRGRMSRWTPQALRDERLAWMLARGREGHSSAAVADALGIGQKAAHHAMHKAGWRWHEQPRRIRRHRNAPQSHGAGAGVAKSDFQVSRIGNDEDGRPAAKNEGWT